MSRSGSSPSLPTVIVPDGAGGTEAAGGGEVDGVESVAVENVGRL